MKQTNPDEEFEQFQADPGLWGAIYSPDVTDGMTRWQIFLWDCGRFWKWIRCSN